MSKALSTHSKRSYIARNSLNSSPSDDIYAVKLMLVNICCYSIHYTVSKLLSEKYKVKESSQILCLAIFFSIYGYFQIRTTKQTPLYFCRQSAKNNLFLGARVLLALCTDAFPLIALQHLRQGACITIMYLYPVWAIFFNNIYFKKCLKLIDVFVSIACIGGVILIMKPFDKPEKTDSLLGFLMANAAAAAWGLMPISNKLTQETFSSNYLIFCTGVTLFFAFPVFYYFEHHEENIYWVSVSLLAVFGGSGVLGFWLFLIATAVGNIEKIISMEYLVVILNFISSVFLFKEKIDWYDFIGAALIISSNVYKVTFINIAEENADPPQVGQEQDEKIDFITVN